MYWMKIQSRQENIIYLALWGMLFAAPVLSLYVRSVHNSVIAFDWTEILTAWKLFAVYLVFFLIHNFLLAPMLLFGRKRLLYGVMLTAIFGCFIAYQCTHRPQAIGMGPHAMEQRMMPDKEPPSLSDERHSMEGEPPVLGEEQPELDKAPHDFDNDPHGYNNGRRLHHPPRDIKRGNHHPPVFLGEHDLVAVVVLILMFGMNIGIKLFFKNRNDQKKLIVLQKQNLEQQLEYLKYQINPHFFMNTLNNIHALVDIDPEKAKDTILELSKMMRFILYEGSKNGVPLTREFEFIRHYVTLMRLRYTDKVDIQIALPDEAPDKTVPPLMLISFIENAFKHGISYQHPSFVHIHVDIGDDKLHFTCRNSKAEQPNQEKGGVGLTNVKQRLHLLYDNNYTLKIQNQPESYNVELTIPLT